MASKWFETAKQKTNPFGLVFCFVRTGSKQSHRVLRQQGYGGCKLPVFAAGEMAVV